MTDQQVHCEPRQRWEKLGLLIEPDPDVAWMVTHAGSSFALPRQSSSLVDIYVTGRDAKNRSRIGRIVIDMRRPNDVVQVDPHPVLELGELGTFDENGTSYPYIVRQDGQNWMYYTGWMPSVLTPFQNHLGLAAEQPDGTFDRLSRAPILERNHDDPFSTGAVCVMREGPLWRMWYTSFQRWGQTPNEPKHTYFIKYAESDDGIHWRRDNHVAIGLQHPGEHSISRPTVVQIDQRYHMWYCYRGQHYRIGYAVSEDGVHWDRRDHEAGIGVSDSGWDCEEICYPHVFSYRSDYYMLYCGNEYGKSGLGIAHLQRDN